MPTLWPIVVAAGGLVALDRLAAVTARPPRRGLDRTAADLNVPHELVEFSSFDGITLRGEWMEPEDVTPERPSVVLVHGWTGNSGTMLLVARPLLEAGYPVFAFDVRLHGRSDDAPFVTIRHFRDDLKHAVEVVRRRRPESPIAVAGHSLGGSAALLAANDGAPIDAVALIASPADLFEVTAGTFSDRGLPGNLVTGVLKPFWQRRAGEPFADLDPTAAASALSVPLLIVQGEQDARVPAEHARRLADSAGSEVLWMETAAHKDILDRPELHAALERFIAGVTRSGEAVRIDVVAAVIRDEGRYLLCRRPAGKRHGGLWEFPGGKVLAGENRMQASQRELREELDLRLVRFGDTLFTHPDPGAPYLIHFVEAAVDGIPRAMEHAEIRWVLPAELAELELAPADRAFADRLEAGRASDAARS